MLSKIFTYPELRLLEWSSRSTDEIYEAIKRYELRERFDLPHPFDRCADEHNVKIG